MFSQFERDEIAELLSLAFETYKETIVIYRVPVPAFTEPAGPNFNFGFEEQPAQPIEYQPVSGTFEATVEYVDQQDNQRMFFPVNESSVQLPFGDVRISVSGEVARDFLENSEKIVIDGKDYRRVHDVMPRGIFERVHFDTWLKKIDNG